MRDIFYDTKLKSYIMIEFILIYISLSIVISVVSHLSEGFKGTPQINMICSLCVICVVLIPMSKAIPEIIDNAKLPEINTEASSSKNNFDQFKESITDNVEVSVKELIESEFDINVKVKAVINFDDMSSIRLEVLEITTDDSSSHSQIYKFLKSIYFCEVKIYEK